MQKEKITIVGGGVAAMTAAVYLTEQADWQQKREITVYQQGWRLGGKGASGRNSHFAERIEEHGLHVWFGAYVNSFRTLQGVYNSLNRPATRPLATWQEAFKPMALLPCRSTLITSGKRGQLIFRQLQATQQMEV